VGKNIAIKDDKVFTSLAVVLMIIFLIITNASRKDNVPCSHEVDALVVHISTKKQATSSLNPRLKLSRNRDTKSRCIWVTGS